MTETAERAIAELRAARSPAIDEALRAEFIDLLGAVPGALHRDGEAFGADGRRIHLTASAIVIDARGDHLALIWHAKGRFWVQPGGHIEPAESSLEAAARREAAEEIGLSDLRRIGPGPALLHRHRLSDAFGPCGEHWDVRYLLAAPRSAEELPLAPSAESPQVRWVPWPDRAGPAADGPGGGTGLPAGTVEDLPAALAALEPCLPER